MHPLMVIILIRDRGSIEEWKHQPVACSRGARKEQTDLVPLLLAGYLCPLSANTYGIEFLEFNIKDYATGKAVYQASATNDSSRDALGPRHFWLPRHLSCTHAHTTPAWL